MGSPGENLGMDFLPGALPMAVPSDPAVDADLAADVVWFDALVTNVDRTPRNPNLLVWHGRLYLIDHGAAFFRQHGERPLAETARDGVPMLAEHVLLPAAGSLEAADERLAERALGAIDAAVALAPDAWLGPDPAARRADLAGFLRERLEAAAAVRGGARACLRCRSATPFCGSCRAWSEGRRSTSAWSSSRASTTSWGCGCSSTTRASRPRARLRPGADPCAARRLRPGGVRRCGRRHAGGAARVRSLRLADGALLDGDPAVRGAHRSHVDPAATLDHLFDTMVA